MADDYDDLEDVDALGEADDVGEVDELDEPESKPRPRAQVSSLTVVLCFLNVIAACAFAFLLLMNYQKRQEWSRAALMHGLAVDGLSLEDEADGLSASKASQAAVHVDPETLKQQALARGAKLPGSEPFTAVNEPLPVRIPTQALSEQTMKDMFRDVGGQPARTLEEEVRSWQAKFLDDVKVAAQNVTAAVQKNNLPPDQKLSLVQGLLLPLATDTKQIAQANQAIVQAAAQNKLDALLTEALQRRLLLDFLWALQMYRPWDPDDLNRDAAGGQSLLTVSDEQKADLKRMQDALLGGVNVSKDDATGQWSFVIPASTLELLATQRFEEALKGDAADGTQQNETIQKRQHLAFLLTALSELRTTPGGNRLYPAMATVTVTENGQSTVKVGRAQVAVGLAEYARSMNLLAGALEGQRERIGKLIQQDADYFVKRHHDQIERLLQVVAQKRSRELRKDNIDPGNVPPDAVAADSDPAKLALLQRNIRLYLARKEDYEDVVARLLQAREKTAELVSELDRLERQLFAAQQQLADAAQTNLRYEQTIREAERKEGVVSAP